MNASGIRLEIRDEPRTERCYRSGRQYAVDSNVQLRQAKIPVKILS